MFDANSLWSEGHRNRSFFRYKTSCIFLYELMEWGKRWYVSNTCMHLFSQAAIRRLSDASWSDNRHLNGRQHWWTGQYVISLWWHEHFRKHMIQSFILGCFFQKKGRTRLSCILDSRFHRSQAADWHVWVKPYLSPHRHFIIKTTYLWKDTECRCLAARWLTGKMGLRTDWLCKGYKVTLDGAILASALSFWHGSRSLE